MHVAGSTVTRWGSQKTSINDWHFECCSKQERLRLVAEMSLAQVGYEDGVCLVSQVVLG